jgi:hypothetical protein
VVSEPPSELETAISVGMVTTEGTATTEEMVSSKGMAATSGVQRWPADALAQFGLEPVEVVRNGASYQLLRQLELCPDRFPRRDGVPAKRPLF